MRVAASLVFYTIRLLTSYKGHIVDKEDVSHLW